MVARFGSVAALLSNISLVAAFECKADIDRADFGHKKPGTRPGFHFPGSGGALLEKLELYAEPFPLVA